MEYRQLPRGNENEQFSVLGLGMGGIGSTAERAGVPVTPWLPTTMGS